jgi:hypothetical protein
VTTTPMPPDEAKRARCAGEPISWLRLERYHASELDAADRAVIEQHLASCPACAACLSSILEGDGVALAPLAPRAAPRLALPEGKPGPRKVVWLRSPRMMAAATTLALAAAVVLGIGRGWWRPGSVGGGGDPEAAGVHVKGGSVTFTLVRDDGERIDGLKGVFRDGDRFKVLVTCPPTLNAGFDVVVFEAGAEPAFPLAPAPTLACGNQVPLAGAMRLTGRQRETVCLVWNEEGTVSRELAAVLLEGGGGARDRTVGLCKELEAAR